MPLNWNIEHTEMWQIRKVDNMSKDNCSNAFINAVGMTVLRKTVGGYNYSLKTSVLTRELMEEIKAEWLADATSEEEKEEINRWLPKMVGAKFIRTP